MAQSATARGDTLELLAADAAICVHAQGRVPWDTFVNTLLPSGQVFVGVATRNWPAPNSMLTGQLLPGTLAGRCGPRFTTCYAPGPASTLLWPGLLVS